MSTFQAAVDVLGYLLQSIFFGWAIFLSFRSKFDQAAFYLALSIMMLLLVRLA